MKTKTKRAKRRDYVAQRNAADRIDHTKAIHKAIRAQLKAPTK